MEGNRGGNIADRVSRLRYLSLVISTYTLKSPSKLVF